MKPDSLLDIIENYVHLAKETDKIWDPYKGKVVEKPKESSSSRVTISSIACGRSGTR